MRCSFFNTRHHNNLQTQYQPGALEVTPSSNPFFQTTGTQIGTDTQSNIKWSYDPNPSMLATSSGGDRDGNFAFLYTRTSDTIGSKVPKPTNSIPTMMTKTEFLRKRREDLANSEYAMKMLEQTAVVSRPKQTAEEILKSYKQGTKIEDPRYTTTNNEFGKFAAMNIKLSPVYAVGKIKYIFSITNTYLLSKHFFQARKLQQLQHLLQSVMAGPKTFRNLLIIVNHRIQA